MAKPLLVRKLKILTIICIFSMIAGMIYQKVNEGFIDYNAFLVGIAMGLGFGVLELFVMTKLNHRLKILPFILVIFTKTFIYTLIIFFISVVLALITGLLQGKTMDIFFKTFFSSALLSLIIYSLIVFSIAIFFLQISRLLGEGVILKLFYGKYNRPVEEERIFMFLDIKSSTTMAEKLGHKKFYSLLNTFFHHITEPLIMVKSEIYQYVGDEVVFTWTTKEGIRNANCINLFFLIKQKVEENREYYLNQYGIVPSFKAGLHYGKVIVGQIGDLKREIVYNGDVLNTTSRIQELCNTYNKNLLISRNLLSKLKLSDPYQQEYIGSVKLRGREQDIYIYGITQKVNK